MLINKKICIQSQKNMVQFVNNNGIIDQNQVTLKMKEDLAKKLIKRNFITVKEVASLCKLSYRQALDINKELVTNK